MSKEKPLLDLTGTKVHFNILNKILCKFVIRWKLRFLKLEDNL